jgi:hypothetical protein
MSPKDGRSKEISQRRDQIARSIIDVPLNGQSPGNHRPPLACCDDSSNREGDHGGYELREAKCNRRAPVSLVSLCALKHPPAVLYNEPCSEIANI